MDFSTAITLAVALMIGLRIPYYIWYIRRGRGHGHTWFTWWKTMRAGALLIASSCFR